MICSGSSFCSDCISALTRLMTSSALALGKDQTPMKTAVVPLKFSRKGIKYDELSDEEKEAWDAVEWTEDGDIPDEVSADEINKFLFNADTIDAPIGVHPVVREKFAVLIENMKVDVSKPAITYYEVAERFKGFTLVKMFPKTGRTHQLRVHCAHAGWPIIGDRLYGRHAPGQQLHLHACAIVLPLSKTKPAIRVEAPPPSHMLAALQACGYAPSSARPPRP